MHTTAHATYTDTGRITVTRLYDDGSELTEDLGTHDADGTDWTTAVDARLAGAGWTRTDEWTGDTATVRPTR